MLYENIIPDDGYQTPALDDAVWGFVTFACDDTKNLQGRQTLEIFKKVKEWHLKYRALYGEE